MAGLAAVAGIAALVTGCGGQAPSTTRGAVPPTAAPTVPPAAAPACPAAVTAAGPANVDPPGDRLLPARPTAGRLCRYYPLLGSTRPGYPHGRLESQAGVDQATAVRLAGLLDTMPRDTDGAHSCPADFGAVDLLAFTFADRPPLTVRAAASGCPSFTNGSYLTGRFSPQFAAYRDLVDSLARRSDQV